MGTSRIQLIGGWPFNFISIIGMQTTFLLLWATLVSNLPEDNKFVKRSEVNYIKKYFPNTTNQRKRIPWRKILTYPPVYAIAASLYGADFIIYSMVTTFPEYLASVRHMSTSLTSMLSGLPCLLCPITSYLASQIVDTLGEKRIVATITTRKISDVIAKPVAGLFLLISSLLPEDYVVSSSVLYATSGILLFAFQGCSWPANMAEMAPYHAGEVFVIAQAVSMTGPFMAPPIFAALTLHNSAGEWQLCFGITFAVLVLTSLLYVTFASSKKADWDEESTELN
ncbi:hypothetical protein V1264_017252 [Littorina saxatilis]|uniref:Sialin n=3 Tax=Littorina saxatilis TaxID=31220 RepID=A0AAN9BIT7_9CAEN